MASSGNFCTFNPLTGGSTNVDFSNGNTTATTNDNIEGMTCTFGIPVGTKFYWEVTQPGFAGSDGDDLRIGVNTLTQPDFQNNRGGDTTSYSYESNSGQKVILGTASSYGTAIRIGNVIGVAIDRVNHTIQFYHNGSGQGTFSIASTGDLFPWIGVGGGFNNSITKINFGQDSTFSAQSGLDGSNANASDANGFGNFYHTPPTGFLALCSDNLPISDDIDPAQTDDDFPQKQFNCLAFTGTGSSNAVTGLGFQPDLVWIKNRSGTQGAKLTDSSRGVTKVLQSATTSAESTDSNGLTAFGSDGFTVGSDAGYNGSSNNMIAWCWRANGGTTASNSSGSITSTVQANTAAGFSIVTYTGNDGSWGSGNRDTFGHGLSAAPEFIIVKERNNTDQWTVFHASVGNGGGSNAASNNLVLNSHDALYTNQSYTSWCKTMPTSTLVTVEGNTTNNSGTNHVAYIWHSVEGYQKFGSYEGNGSTDGPFIYTGFRPRMVFVKQIDGGAEWAVYDTARDTSNEMGNCLQWDLSASEKTHASDLTTDAIMFFSNGFKLTGGGGGRTNQSGRTFVFGAWGDVPFKYNNTF